MKRKVLALLGSLLTIGLVAAGLLWAQDKASEPAAVAPPADQEPNAIYFSADDEWEEPPAIEHLPHAGAVMAAPFGPGHRAFAFSTLEGGGRAWLGLQLADVTAEKAKELKLPGEYGTIVKHVQGESPAAKAGLAKDDVILEFAGQKVWSATQFRRLVRETPPGRSVTLLVSRAGQTQTLTATLTEVPDRVFNIPLPAPMPAAPGIRVPEFDVFIHRGARLGISGDELTSQLAGYFGVKQGKGVLVREVVVGSAAEKAGLKAGDVIIRVDAAEIGSVRELRRALGHDADAKRKLTLTIVRDRREQTLAVELEPSVKPPPRHAVELDLPEIDPEELNDMADEIAAGTAQIRAHAAQIRAQAAEARKHGGEAQRELQEQTKRWQEEWQRQLQQQQRELREEIHRGLRAPKPRGDARVV